MAEVQDADSFSPEHARLREHLDQLRSENRPIKWQRRFDKVAASLEELLASYRTAVEERRTLEQRIWHQTSMLQLLDLEQGWDADAEQDANAAAAAAGAAAAAADPAQPTPMATSPPAAAAERNRAEAPASTKGDDAPSTSAPSPCHPPPSSQPLHFLDLPGPAAWRRSWDRRIQCLTSRDLAQLHSEWLQLSAVLLYKAELLGPPSAEHQQLQEYADCYAAFNQQAIRLIPRQWRRRSLYDLKTLQPRAPPAPVWFEDFLTQHCARTKQHLQRAFQLYRAQAAALRQQYSVLLERYLEALQSAGAQQTGAGAAQAASAQATGTAPPARTAAPSHPPADRPSSSNAAQGLSALLSSSPTPSGQDDTFYGAANALDDALSALQCNLLRQQLVLRQWLFALRFSDDIVEHVKVHLLLYPQALDVIDFLEAAAADEVAAAGGQAADSPSDLLRASSEGDAGGYGAAVARPRPPAAVTSDALGSVADAEAGQPPPVSVAPSVSVRQDVAAAPALASRPSPDDATYRTDAGCQPQ